MHISTLPLIFCLVFLPLALCHPGWKRDWRETTTTVVFNATANPYVAPGPGDQRGPCPGLNTLANHGYIPHNGIATCSQIVDAMVGVFSYEPVYANIVCTYELAYIGDVLSETMSIGGAASGWHGLVPWYSAGNDYHGAIEADSSLTRDDFYFGDNHSFNLTKWNQLVDLAATYTNPWQRDFFADVRYYEWSQATLINPAFFYGPLQLITLSTASYFAEWGFRLPEQPPTLATMTSFFVNETFPVGFGPQSYQINVLDSLNATFYNLLKHPVPLPALYDIPFPLDVKCMVCWMAAILSQDIPLLGLSLITEILTNLQCLYPDCLLDQFILPL